RRLLVGLIPTSSREAFQAAPELSPILDENDKAVQDERKKYKIDPRLEEAKGRVTDILDNFKAHTVPAGDAIEISRYILLDLADILSVYLHALWQAIKATTKPTETVLADLYQLFTNKFIDPTSTPKISWLAALQAVAHEI